ncbi:MAG: RidA family protein [Chloroflexi bacterium]|nr:RidA family protein [Chloroflexota bacterium]
MRIELLNPPGEKRPPAFSQGAVAGDWVFVSGQLAWTRDGGIAGKGDIKAQSERAFEHIEQVLRMAGGGLSDVVKLTAYLVDPRHFQGYWDVRRRLFPSNAPASTTVAATALAFPEALIEIEAYAHLGKKTRFVMPSPPGGPAYSQGARAGNTIWVSGQTSQDLKEGKPQAVGDFPGQLHIALRNVNEVLKAAGAGPKDLVKINYFLTNPLYYKDLFQIRADTFKERAPGDDVASIRALALPELLVEAEAVAVVPPAKVEYINPPDVPQPFSFSQVVIADGLVYVSGQTPWDKDRKLSSPGDFEGQLAQAYRNVEACLKAAGCTFNDVAKITYYITNSTYFARSREVRARFVGESPPAITAIVVDGIGGFPELMCEVDAIAVLP